MKFLQKSEQKRRLVIHINVRSVYNSLKQNENIVNFIQKKHFRLLEGIQPRVNQYFGVV